MSIYNKNKILHNYISRLNIDVLLSYHSYLDHKWVNQNKCNAKNYLYLITNNKCHVRINNKDYFPHKGQMILIPRGSCTFQETVNREPFSKYWSVFDANIEHTDLFEILRPPLCVDTNNTEKALSLFSELSNLNFRQDLFSALRTKSIFIEILTIFFQSANDMYPDMDFFRHDDFTETIIEFINNHYRENITIDDMAKHTSFHPKYFSHIFKDKIGVTPMKFLKRIRMDHAKFLLLHSNENIEEIMYQCGFSNKSLFSKDFKSETGCTPSEYRELRKL